jgi:hypothetical protein
MRALALIAAVAALGLVAAGSAARAAPLRQVAAGSARFDANGVSRVFRFSATQTTAPNATGWATVDYAEGPRLRLEITCLRVFGMRALIAGRISASTVRTNIGRTAVFGIEDGGQPPSDRFTLVYIAESKAKPYSCTRFPPGMALLKPTKGAARIGPSMAQSA